MISFVWSPGQPLPAGTGGSENYTVGHVRELNRRGVAAQVVTTGLGSVDGRDDFRGIPFHSLAAASELGTLEGQVVFVNEHPHVATRQSAYQMLHTPPPLRAWERRAVRDQLRHRCLIATSRYAARTWSEFLDVDPATIDVVYPFAEPCFGRQQRPSSEVRTIRILYAGRLSPEKGVYTLMEALHSDLIAALVSSGVRVSVTATAAGADKPQGRIIHRLLAAHPGIELVAAQKTPEAMATLMAEHDVVVMPSNSQYWHETFGIVSIEAQHAGCRVVASDDGGLPETDCGAVVLVAPDDADALAEGICRAVAMGVVPTGQGSSAAMRFTVGQSVDGLLAVLGRVRSPTPAEVIDGLEELVRLPSAVHATGTGHGVPAAVEAPGREHPQSTLAS